MLDSQPAEGDQGLVEIADILRGQVSAGTVGSDLEHLVAIGLADLGDEAVLPAFAETRPADAVVRELAAGEAAVGKVIGG